MIARRSFSHRTAPALRGGASNRTALVIGSLCLLGAACSGDDDDTKWAPRRGNGTAPEGAHAPSSVIPGGTAGSGSATSGGTGKFDTSNVPSFDPGATSDRPLDSLSDDELEALCERVKSYFLHTVSLAEFESAQCYQYENAVTLETVGECLDAVDDCLTNVDFEYIDCAVTSLKGDGEDCAASVDDYAGCVEENLSYNKAAVDYWDCKRDPSADEPSQLSAFPEACVKFDENCSAL